MPLQLEIVSPERRAFTDEVDMVVVPGIDGELGILPHHTRLISALGIGELKIKKGGTETLMFISGGFVEVRPDKVIIMADLAEHSDEIDEARAVEAHHVGHSADAQQPNEVRRLLDRAEHEGEAPGRPRLQAQPVLLEASAQTPPGRGRGREEGLASQGRAQ